MTGSKKADGEYDPQEYKKLISRRHKVSRMLLDLRDMCSKAEGWAKPASGKAQEAYAWNRLVGAAFALWRTIPLMLESLPETSKAERNPTIHVEHGAGLLEELLRHNRVAYEQERKTSYWMAGFYLNDAEDRIDSVRRIHLKHHVEVGALKAARRVGRNVKRRRNPLLGERAKRCAVALRGLAELILILKKID